MAELKIPKKKSSFLSFLKIFNFGYWIKWDKIISKLFGAYRPHDDTEILLKEESFGTKYVIVIRKSLWYSIFHGAEFLLSFFLLFVNIWLLLHQNLDDTSRTIVIIFLSLNVLYGIYTFITYLMSFRKLYGKYSKVDSIYTYLQRSVKGDEIYTKFFNQTVSNIVLLFGISIYIIIHLIFDHKLTYSEIGLVGLNIFILFIQLYLLIRVKVNINNQEMDFCIVTPTKFYLYDQLGYTDRDKNDFPVSKIRNVKGTYGPTVGLPSLVGSLFKYGTLLFLLEGGGDGGDKTSVPKFEYTPSIDSTTNEVSLFLDTNGDQKEEDGSLQKRYKVRAKEIPLVLTYILYNLQIDINAELDNVISKGTYRKEIRKFMLENKNELLKLYNEGDSIIKEEIVTLGKYYINGED